MKTIKVKLSSLEAFNTLRRAIEGNGGRIISIVASRRTALLASGAFVPAKNPPYNPFSSNVKINGIDIAEDNGIAFGFADVTFSYSDDNLVEISDALKCLQLNSCSI